MGITAEGINPRNPKPRHFHKKQQPETPRHSRAGGNLEPQRGRNLSDTAETERTGFPPARE
ncbi:hypothetical protein E5O75_03430 [Neisseria gonorrhoeae]|nr:hypothetical protein EGO84_02660 [Neisseria gonorrhoeae]ROU26688.1 hypothetical protein EGP18_01795 [Neisseria gonorrhoeae]ROU68474.1 hypothetical protein EGO76_02525 [Neisseria gonorrhoeae]ROU98430.1 hypothetical protein EGP16_02255 [Neisseria gonorrhoeae]ROV03603.1 hypothetical protein EGP19_02995 [Neisseria gonorrhoeae]